VLLVPNKNLETPNYRLERLRHDDPRLENLQASYTMVDEQEEEVGITRREKTKAKQEPVIKGILPETPAPKPAERPQPVAAAPAAATTAAQRLPVARPAAAAPAPAGGGFFAWVKGLFGTPAEEPAKPALKALPAPATMPGGDAPRRDRSDRGERGDRGGRGGRGGRGRGERGERSGERTAEGSEAQGRGRRGDRSADAARVGEAGTGEGREPREAREPRDAREPREARDTREGREPREPREGRGGRGERGNATRNEARADDGRGEPRRDGRNGGAARLAAAPAKRGRCHGRAGHEPAVRRHLAEPAGTEGDAAQGERQGGRRRNRRGGRGTRPRRRAAGEDGSDRDKPGDGRDDGGIGRCALGRRVLAHAPEVPSTDIRPTDAHGDELGLQTVEGAAAEPRGEGSRRRGRGRGRDRERAPREGEQIGSEAFAAERSESVDPMFVPFSSGLDVGAETEREARGDAPMTADEPSPRRMEEAPREPLSDPWRAQEPARSAPVVERTPQSVASAPAETSAATATSYALPLDSLVAVAESAGLQWVNSDAAKIEAAQAAMAATAEPIRVARDIPPVAAVDDGPLVLVETKKDLSQVKLPFETTPRETQGL
jgi:ribonuclease E